MKKYLSQILIVFFAFVGLAACGGGSGSSSSGSGSGGSGSGSTGGVANSRLNGTYTFYLNGLDSSSAPYSVAGSVTFNGSGTISAGEQDLFDGSSGTVDTADAITSGTYAVGSDGRGTITLTTTNVGSEVLAFAIVNDDHLLITEFDSSATSSGTMDLQTATTTVQSGGWSFTVFDPTDDFALAGALVSDGSASFTTGIGDQSLLDSTTSTLDITNNVALTGSFSVPDSMGRGTITLNDTSLSTAIQFAYYAVGPEVYRLVEIDSNASFSGSMYSQGTGGGGISAASIAGRFAFDTVGADGSAIGNIAAAGVFTADGSAIISNGVADVNDGTGTVVEASAFSGTYSVSPTGRGVFNLTTSTELANFGVYIVDPTLNIEDPNNTTGALGGALIIELDTAAIGTGVVVPQTSTGTLSGTYTFGMQTPGENSGTLDETDFVGSLKAASGKVSGTIDLNDIGVGTTSNLAYSGTIGADTSNPGRLVLSTNTSGGILVDAVGYDTSSGQVLLVSVNTNIIGVGIVQPYAGK